MLIGSLISVIGTIFAVGIFFANVIIAVGVYNDAEAIYRSTEKELRIFPSFS